MELKFDPEKPKYEYITTPDAFENAIALLEKEPIIAVDIESTGLDPYTALLLIVQIGTEEISYIFDARLLNLKENPRLKSLLENPKILKLLQNGKFDYKMIKIQLKIEINNIYDTMLAEAILTAGLGTQLGLLTIVRKYVNIDLDKSIRKTFEKLHKGSVFTQEQLAYGAMDTLVLFPVFNKQWPLLQKENLIKIAKLEFATTTVVGDMELNGIYIDVTKWRSIISELSTKRDLVAKEFQDVIRPYYPVNQMDMFTSDGYGDAINLNSNVQLLDLLNNKLGLNVPSTGVEILSTLQHPIAKKLLEYRGFEKLISAFGESLLEKVNPVTHRLHPDFQQLRTATGRFACSNPNLQQIPRNSKEAPFRECFNSEPGYKLVTADYSSFEMRILADLSKDPQMIKGMKEGFDMHSFTAALMFNKEYADDFKKKYPELRQAAKAIGFGLMYGMGPAGLATQIGVTKEVGEEYMKNYFNAFPKVKEYLESSATKAVQVGWSMTPAGRKRWYDRPVKTDPEYKRKISSIQRQAKNHPIQGTNADAVKYALVFLKDRIAKEKVDARIILTVHDEIVCEVREDQAEMWGPIQKEEMEKAGELFIKEVPVIAEPFIGDVWEH
ncbi:hypothetical protein HYV31_02365 [candidate division WWE3 bacterium]|nr:hypothetical protein [candidate division WWE3 bacterium]